MDIFHREFIASVNGAFADYADYLFGAGNLNADGTSTAVVDDCDAIIFPELADRIGVAITVAKIDGRIVEIA